MRGNTAEEANPTKGAKLYSSYMYITYLDCVGADETRDLAANIENAGGIKKSEILI